MNRALLAVAVLALAGCEVNLDSEGVVSRETKRFDVTGVPTVELETFDGAIELHSWDRNEVEVEIERRAMEQRLVDDIRITAEQQGDRVVVKVTGPERSDDFEGLQIGVNISPSARLRVALPRRSNVTATTSDGSVSVEDVSGELRLTTSDGSVRASRVGGQVVVRTGDGTIRLDDAEGGFDLETDDGSITVEGTVSALRARTSDGSIRVNVEPDSAMSGDWDIQTGDGSVTLTLPSDFAAALDAETRDGAVRTNHPSLSAQQRDDGERRDGDDRRALKATLGQGGHTLRVRTGDGTIRIE